MKHFFLRFSQHKGVVFFLLICFLFVGILSPNSLAARHKSKPYVISAKSAIFSDATRVKRLYGKAVHKHILPASTTKVMTALLVLEHLPLTKIVRVSKRATKVQPSKLYLKPGERIKVSQLLYALLISSANDASVVLAEAVAGSEKKFVRMMNKRARQLGARHTRFVNPHGLPSKKRQYSTAYDMYVIFLEALKFPFFRKALSYKYKTIHSENGRVFKLKNHNKLLWKKWEKTIRGKTGWTKKAKACFIGYFHQGERTFIIGVFGCTRRWQDIKYIIQHYGKISL